MRRVSALVVLGVFLLGTLSQFLRADPASKLPACCRKDGNHRCSMSAMSNGSASAGLKNGSARCPLYPKSAGAPARSSIAGALPAQQVFQIRTSQPEAVAQLEARYRMSFSRARQQRGPPSPTES
jgi:hypothetical protein